MIPNSAHDLLRRILSIGLIVPLLAALASGCASTPERKFQKNGLTLVYRSKSAAGSEIEDLRLQHPVQLSQDALFNHLLSLRFEELSLMGREKYVFSVRNIERIGRLLTKAVHHLKPDHVLHYELETPKGTTVGQIFATHNKLNWRFSKIRGIEFGDKGFGSWGTTTWRLVPQSGQTYHTTKRFLGTRTDENWIMADLQLPQTSRRVLRHRSSNQQAHGSPPAASPPRTPPTATDPELEQKLRALKQFHDKGLIDDRDYERKKKELLDSYL